MCRGRGGHRLSLAEVACLPLLRLLVAKGLRHGEALAAGWSDADLTNGLLRVRGTLLRVNGHLVISEPKTERLRALTCPCPPRLWRSWVVKASQVGERVKAASIWVETGLVFITENGTAVDPRNPLRAINNAAKALGISGVGLHRFRHATPMLAAGVPLHTVSELLGHSCVAVTGGVYGHPPRRVCLPPSSGSSEQWAGENVCRCYTVATRQQRGRLGSCPKRPLTCCFPSG